MHCKYQLLQTHKKKRLTNNQDNIISRAVASTLNSPIGSVDLDDAQKKKINNRETLEKLWFLYLMKFANNFRLQSSLTLINVVLTGTDKAGNKQLGRQQPAAASATCRQLMQFRRDTTTQIAAGDLHLPMAHGKPDRRWLDLDSNRTKT